MVGGRRVWRYDTVVGIRDDHWKHAKFKWQNKKSDYRAMATGASTGIITTPAQRRVTSTAETPASSSPTAYCLLCALRASYWRLVLPPNSYSSLAKTPNYVKHRKPPPPPHPLSAALLRAPSPPQPTHVSPSTPPTAAAAHHSHPRAAPSSHSIIAQSTRHLPNLHPPLREGHLQKKPYPLVRYPLNPPCR